MNLVTVQRDLSLSRRDFPIHNDRGDNTREPTDIRKALRGDSERFQAINLTKKMKIIFLKQCTKTFSWLKEVRETFHSETEQTWKMLSNPVQTGK